MGTENKADNKLEELGGKAKEAVGNATGDEALSARASTTRARPTSSRPARR